MKAARRDVLMGALFSGGALLVGAFPKSAHAADVAAGGFGPFIRIGADGVLTVIAKFAELGQGNHSGMAALAADELDAAWPLTRVEASPAIAKTYQRGTSGRMSTGGSGSIPDSWMQLRRAGATARAMFVAAAAQKWGIAAPEITIADSIISHAATGRKAGFGELVALAAQQKIETEPALKQPAQFKLIGNPAIGRLDARAKSTGTATFTQDVRLPGMLTAMVAHSPRFGGTVKSFEDRAARAVAGVVAVHRIPQGVAVVAKNTYAAKLGRDALKLEWDDSAAEMRSTAAIAAEYAAIASGGKAANWVSFASSGTVATDAFAKNAVTLDLALPFLAHAAMEPMNCVAQVDGTKVRLTYGVQRHTADQEAAAAIVGGTSEEVEIVSLPAGGSFGRRSVPVSDYQREAVEIAKRVGGFTPVKMVWTREDDMAHGQYRPMTHHRARIALDAAGYPLAWEHRLVSASLFKNTPVESNIRNGIDPSVVEGVRGSPYFAATPVVDAQVHMPDTKIPVLWLRSVGATHTAFAMEHFVDQLAHRAKIDPLAYRRELYRRAKAERHLAVLNLAAEKAGWGKPLPKGRARGIAVHECFGSVVANVAEVSLVKGVPKVHHVVCAIDCGTAVHPDQVKAQMEGGIAYGLGFHLFGEVKINDGRVETTNFDTYRVLRMDEMPMVDVHILPSTRPPTGVGEPGTPVVGPAVANAVLTLTGKPTTALPLVKA